MTKMMKMIYNADENADCVGDEDDDDEDDIKR